jgi:phosphoglycolate phosphatase
MGHLRQRYLIAFDLDGTLIDSLRDLADSVNQLVQQYGGTPVTDKTVACIVGEGAAILVRRALHAAGLGEVPGALDRFREIYDSRLLAHSQPYPGIPEALRGAHARARLAVVTNKATAQSEQILQAFDLRDLFDEVIGGDGPFPRKPEPASLVALMNESGAEPATTLVVGDSAIDHETARRASARCCLAAYGFGYTAFPAERLTGDEWIVSDAAALAGVIEQFTAG